MQVTHKNNCSLRYVDKRTAGNEHEQVILANWRMFQHGKYFNMVVLADWQAS